MARFSLLFGLFLLWTSAQAQEIDPCDDSHDTEDQTEVRYFPPLDYVPHPRGIPFPLQDFTAAPWLHLSHPPKPVAYKTAQTTAQRVQTVQTSAGCPASTGNTSKFWYEGIEHNGESSFLSPVYKNNYQVFRNVVTDFGADKTGSTTSADAIQAAIEAGASNGPSRGSHSMGTTGQPAIVYLPSGLYVLDHPLQLFVGTVLMGDPTNPPVLKATANFTTDHLVYAKDPNFGGTVNFYIGIKNIVLDSTAVAPSQKLSLLDWTVSQATQLSNVLFNMPVGAVGHVGLTTTYGYNSNVILNNLRFVGGAIGMSLSGQQWVFKNLEFIGTAIGVVAGGTNVVFLACRFQNGGIGIDASGTSGSLTVIDTNSTGLGTLINSYSSTNAGNSIILENVLSSGNTVTLGGNAMLVGNMTETWIHGDLYPPGDSKVQHVAGEPVHTPRVTGLLSDGANYFTTPPPTYKDHTLDQIVNIKNVTGLRVFGDGKTDDTANINSVLAQSAGCKVIYFPAGTYIVTDTIFVPANTRIIGDAFASVISAAGSNFMTSNSPKAMIRVGYPGDVGVVQISDMLFSVSDILPGCKLVEVNIAGQSPGDVGFWNTHFRIGGAVGSQVESRCNSTPDQCKAAWGLIHLTSTSSVYIENMWGWTADHDLDGNNTQTISTGRGMLIEAQKATWLIGTAFEHHTLYQYNFENAQNVFSAMQQSETPYWQGPGSSLAPAPWGNDLLPSDPGFTSCAADDALCRMALFERIQGSSNLYLYGGCNWAFFNNNGGCNGTCQKNAVQVTDSSHVYMYSTNSKSTTNMILDGTTAIATEAANAGGWGGVVAAYLYNS